MSLPVLLPFVCAALAVLGHVSSVPTQQQQQQQQQQQRQEEGSTGGLPTIVWSVLNDCFGGEDMTESATVCLKSKALTALDRALSKPTVAVADGVSLAARTGKSLQFDQQTDRADRAALDAAKDSDQKNALLNDMLADRVDQLMSTRTIVMDAPAVQEGRGKKGGGGGKDKTMKKAMMMIGMMAVAVIGPMMMKMTGLLAIKALIVGKIALILSLIMLIKKLMSQKQGGHSSSHSSGHSSSWENESEPAPYGRSLLLDAHDMAYSGQGQ